MIDEIKKYIKAFFEGLKIDIQSLEIIEENGDFFFVKIQSNDSALLIGKLGTTIESMQRILSMCLNNISEDKIKLKLEINDYCKTYDDRLFARVDSSIISLKNNGGEYDLGDLNAYDRKKVHSYIARSYTDILSKSRGKGDNRRLFLLLNNKNNEKTIFTKKSKLTIDIDGDDI